MDNLAICFVGLLFGFVGLVLVLRALWFFASGFARLTFNTSCLFWILILGLILSGVGAPFAAFLLILQFFKRK